METVVEVGTKLSDRKGVSVPDTTIGFSALTPKDRSDLEAALDTGVDWIALSFIQPGKPQQNAYVERYNRTVRQEWLEMKRARLMAKWDKTELRGRLKDIEGRLKTQCRQWRQLTQQLA